MTNHLINKKIVPQKNNNKLTLLKYQSIIFVIYKFDITIIYIYIYLYSLNNGLQYIS